MALALISTPDTVEIIRDQVAALIKSEQAAQVAAAQALGEQSPSDWALRVFTERANAWQQFNADNKTPLVNVWLDSSTFNYSRSNIMERQACKAVINIDCIGYGVSADNTAGGHAPGDEQAARNAQRAARLVRNILMSAANAYLGLRGVVWSRRVESITMFQPQSENVGAAQVVAARVALSVEYNEFGQQIAQEILELISADIYRDDDGGLIAEADYT